MWRWILGGAVVLLIAFGLAVAAREGDWGDGRWDRDDGVERIVNADGTESLVVGDDARVERIQNTDGTETIVVRDRWDRDGFPFGIIVVPLVILGAIALVRGIFGRGPRGGPGRWGGPGGRGDPGAGGYGPPWAYAGPSSSAPAAGEATPTEPTVWRQAPVATPSPHAPPAPPAAMAATVDPDQAAEAPAWFREWLRRSQEGQQDSPPMGYPPAGPDYPPADDQPPARP